MNKKKIAIIGAGISGLAAGKLLSKNFDITIFEKKNHIGGIARTKDIDGVAYHLVGGHCFNSKNKSVMNFVFNEVLPKKKWHLVERKAKINFKNNLISYPIEFALKEIAQFDEDLAFNIVKDFLITKPKKAKNLADWFKINFGTTLAKEYFIPYNKKIWNKNPHKMSHLWIEGKLPLPNKKTFFNALLGNVKDTMPHQKFYYPNSNNQNSLIYALGKNLNIIKNLDVTSIEKIKNKWLINDKLKFDHVVSTVPLNLITKMVKKMPKHLIKESEKLKYNKVTNVLWTSDKVNSTWTYFPDKDTIFHRHIHIGNFFKPKKNYTITECIGEHSYKKMIKYGKKFNYLNKPIAYNLSDHAYVVYDKNYLNSSSKIKNYLSKIKLFTLGRFGEWEYYNMDICIESAMKLTKYMNKNFV